LAVALPFLCREQRCGRDAEATVPVLPNVAQRKESAVVADVSRDGLRGALAHAGFFVLRTPLLPIEALLSWGDGLEARVSADAASDLPAFEQKWASDVGLLRTRLRAILERPEIVQALYIASPALRSGIDAWLNDPDSKKGVQAERAIVRYFERMSTRSTPFGLFSGCSVGSIGDGGAPSVLRLQPQSCYRTSSRLDFDYLFALSGALRRDEALMQELSYWPNSSLRRIAGAWHYTESRLQGATRSHHLVKLEDDPFLAAALDRARAGAAVAELVEAVVSHDTDDPPTDDEAKDFVLDLVRSDVLVPELTPLVTGEPALDDLIRQLAVLPSGAAASATLESARQGLAALDEKAPGSAPEAYESIAAGLKGLPAEVDPAKLYQVDMRKPVLDARLGEAVIDELLHATEILVRLGPTNETDELRAFREAFAQRYEQAMVPLLEALDEETGVPFGRAAGEGSPLLRGLAHGGGATPAVANGGSLNGVLVRKLVQGGGAVRNELELTDDDLPPVPARHTLPDSFCLLATLVASPEALEDGSFQMLLRGGFGPSGARMFGRFCHADPELDRCVREYLRQEELHDPEAIYAEIVYVPEGRVGNVLCRPRLREYEIPYLARSGAVPDRQLPLTDLLIGIEGDRLVLRSRRLGRRVVPRLTNAHGFLNPTLPAVYRLLCHLQHQGKKGVPGFSWGPLDALDFLPRVRVGRVVVSLARWRLSKADLEPLTQPSRSARFLAMQALRRERGFPRWVVYHEADNALPADLDNPLSVDALADVLKRASAVEFTEMFPGPGELCAHSDEGRFCHELNVPMVLRPRVASEATTERGSREAFALAAPVDRRFRALAPGSEWLYLKLYGGTVALDELLTGTVPPLIDAATATGALERWFFIRYQDPHDHLRLRFNGRPDRIRRDVLPLVIEALNPLLASGRIWKIQFDTYDREIERYGGPDAILSAEDYFFSDSAAVLAILRNSLGDEGQDPRWRAALCGVDTLLADFGFDLEARRVIVGRWRDQRYTGTPGKQQLADRLRTERKQLEQLLWAPRKADGEFEFVWAAFDERSRRMAGVVERLRSLSAAGQLGVDMVEVAHSYAHMHVNRMIRFAATTHELVIYDFLFRLYEAQIARARRASTSVTTSIS
jgi:lantibiotic biosynthesis protein